MSFIIAFSICSISLVLSILGRSWEAVVINIICLGWVTNNWVSSKLFDKVSFIKNAEIEIYKAMLKGKADQLDSEVIAFYDRLYAGLDYEKVYCSIPISGIPIEEVKRRLSLAKKMFKSVGKEPVIPTENGLPADAPYEEHMKRDLELLSGCDAIYMMDGWQDSNGCRVEFEYAIETKKLIMFQTLEDSAPTNIPY